MRSTSRSAIRKRRGVAAACAAAIAFASGLATAAPHVPASDATIVERLPASFLALRRLQPATAASAEPTSVDAALAQARHYIELGQTYSDPRAYGYAQAALGKWWSADPAPGEVLVMRARILQFRHDFGGALAQLEAALRHDQFDPDAWLLFASIAQVQGNTLAARGACLKLIPIADPLVGATCAASTAALSGNAAAAQSLLARALEGKTAATPGERTWAWTTLAEVRAHAGDAAAAETAFRAALAISPDDVYARAAYADLLLDAQRAGEARTFLGDALQADAVLLRAAIAAQRAGDVDAAKLASELAQRFDEARARGDDTHLREQARFALEVAHDPQGALGLARRNFEVQHEPADARVLLEAANAAGDEAAKRPVREWLAKTGMREPRLERLAQANAAGVRN